MTFLIVTERWVLLNSQRQSVTGTDEIVRYILLLITTAIIMSDYLIEVSTNKKSTTQKPPRRPMNSPINTTIETTIISTLFLMND